MTDQLIMEWYGWDAMYTLSAVLVVFTIMAGIVAAVSVPVACQCTDSDAKFKTVLRFVTLPLIIIAVISGVTSALLPSKGAADLAKKHIEMRLEALDKSVSKSAKSVSKNEP